MLHRLKCLMVALIVTVGGIWPAAARDAMVPFSTLLGFAERASTSYKSPAAIAKAYPNTTRIATPGGASVLYFIETDHAERVHIVTVRGTADAMNDSEDRDTHERFDPVLGIKVHRGFDIVTQDILTDLKPHLKPGYTVTLTGHSLGGAVACLLGMYLQHDGGKLGGIYTFGQPKVTNRQGAETFADLPLTRVVDQNDIVPMLPDGTDGKGHLFEHTGPEIILLDGPYYVALSEHKADRLSVDQFAKEFYLSSLPDHAIRNYVKRLREKTSKSVEVAYKDRERYVVRQRPVGTKTEEDNH